MPTDENPIVPPDADYRIRRDAVSLAIESRTENNHQGDYIEARAIRIENYLRTGAFPTRH